MPRSPKFLDACTLADRIGFTLHQLDVCTEGHVGCWYVTALASCTLQGHVVRVPEKRYEHLSLAEALDVAGTVALHYAAALEATWSILVDDRQQVLPLE